MQIFYRCCVLLLCTLTFVNIGLSQNNSKHWDIATEGREFWLAVPLNDNKAQPTIQLEFYVTSKYNTLVTLEVPGTGYLRSKMLKANQVVVFSTKDETASYDFEIITSQIPDPRGIHIIADKPVSVYMLNAKQVTADGYLALPVRTWGTEYIHCSYYDFNEFRPLAGGFIIVASEDNTEVTITLRGRGGDVGKTRSGSKIGDIFSILLKRGEVYNVVGDATTIGVFDLSGSKITANKPIGLISYHERTMLPINNTEGRDHMCEMIPPVSAWGKKYASIELQRDNKGDYYRVVASEANTTVKMKHYDKTTKALLGLRDIVLAKPGDFYEDYNTWVGSGATVGFNGTTVWEANKPILVAQYAYSANWDNGKVFDPFMVVLTPLEQYLTSSLFQTPTSEAFVNNYYSFIVEGDTADIAQTKLKSFVLDGDTVYKSYSQLLINNIPGTNLYWGIRSVGQGAHRVTSKTRFGGYLYGFGTFNSYGWPGTLNTRCLSQLDTLPPVLTSTDNGCGNYSYHATEVRDFSAEPSDTNQHDQGIMDIFLVDSVSSNYTLQLVTADRITPLPKVKQFDFKLLVKDKTKDAQAVFAVMDRAGNYVLDTVQYKVHRSPDVTPSSLSLQVFKADTTVTTSITLTNQTQESMFIESVSLGSSTVFSITGGAITSTLELIPSGTHTITISYHSINASSSDTTRERDTMRIKFSACAGEKVVPLEGRFIPSSVNVSTNILTIKAKTIDSAVVSTITISNLSVYSVHLQSVSLSTASVFTISKGNIDSDYLLPPLASHEIEVQYKPTAASIGRTDYDTLSIDVLGGVKQRITLQGTVTAPSLVEDGNAAQAQFTMTATPNPADESVMVNVNSNSSELVHLRLFDAIGREISACSVELTGDSNIHLPNVSQLPIGVYRLVATSTEGFNVSTILLMIQR